MTPLVDIIEDVIDAMKPDFSSALASNSGTVVNVQGLTTSITDCLFLNERMKVTISGTIVYGTITTLNATAIAITLETATTGAVTAVNVVLNYHYGHPLEIVNTFSEMVKSPTHKTGMFPAICLMMDFDEQMNLDGYQSVSKPTIVILTDTEQEYKAAERYADTFLTVLYPLYELFLQKLDESTSLETYTQVHTKTDRLYWGKKGIYGNVGNIFNDFIDAIEINDLEIRINLTC